MFTGLVEATGTVVSLIEKGEQATLILDIPFADELALGDSVATNGCCLTVASLDDKVSFDLLAQTLKVTSLGGLQQGRHVNLERALAVGDRLGGHFVQGHVDDTGTITDLSPMGQDYRLEVALPESVHSLCIDKGSLCIDGISLTIAELTAGSAVFWITPHTLQATHLGEASVGQKVNLEADLLAKYVKKLVQPG
ncbi:riboflavin synthase [Akkermansiaceae bacterium]|jgi:riboflavin synthase|nr:riboflavin synthase [bacterium]MDA7929949.1 riboflavin synthase [Akkermansiaceae bacterium]MDA7933505.1 riboflavin synthase [Akkermansiaceae bacterium]MDA9831038.1 riboflavin synthase [Akkermansiaceae bacterium]MDB4382495.1 riboflavin synthase [Akkermansiaceae bacterium]